MRDENHLDPRQVDLLIRSGFPEADTHEEAGLLDNARLHLFSCEACQGLVAMHRASEEILRRLENQFPQAGAPGCPSEGALVRLAAGLTEGEESETLLAHAEQCEKCGVFLRRALESFDDVQSDEETSFLASLRSGQPDGQGSFVQRLAAMRGDRTKDLSLQMESTRRGNVSKVPQWGYWLAAAAMIVAVALLILRPGTTVQEADALLAKAYSEHRSFELRVAGAKWAPLQVQRGPEASLLNRPAALLKAETMIASQLERDPSNAAWLQAKARADLIDGNFESAIKALEKAQGSSPGEASLFTDLATAYFERAERTGQTSDYARAFELLSQRLAKAPDDHIALFNRAIISEKMLLHTQAVEDWNHYLRIESSSDWQKEAREHLAEIEKILQQQKEKGSSKLSGVETFLAAAEEIPAGDSPLLDSLAEPYEVRAIEDWLPQRYESGNVRSERNASIDSALSLMSEHLIRAHDDVWLRDITRELPRTGSSPGMEALAEAHLANLRGDHIAAIRLAEQAVAEFGRVAENAGRIRAEFEAVYANHLAAHGLVCYRGARALSSELRNRGYRWIEVQNGLESAACASEVSRVDESLGMARKSLEDAKSSAYGNLELRGLTFVAGLTPDFEESLKLLRGGMELYWRGKFEPMRGYSLYEEMDADADHLRLWNFDAAVIREALKLVQDDPDLSMQGIEQFRLARAYIMIGDTAEANRTFAIARDLLGRSKSRELIPDISIDLAEVFVQKGQNQEALELLNTVEGDVTLLSHDILLSRFYSVRGSAQSALGKDAAAEQSLASAIALSKRGIASIADERARREWAQNFGAAYRSLSYAKLRKDPVDSLLWWEAYKGVTLGNSVEEASLARPDSDSAPKLPALETWTVARAAVLSYMVLPQGVALWVVDGSGVHTTWVETTSDRLLMLARQFVGNCSDPHSSKNTIVGEGRELYDLFVKPAEKWLNGRSRLIIETDGPLAMIPFEALVDQRGKYVGESYEIQYSPGLFYISATTRQTAVDRSSRALVVGNPLLDSISAMPPLPDAVGEAREIAREFTGSHILLGADATLPVVLRELPQADVFHFAGHGVANREVTGLLLAGSSEHGQGALTAEQLNRKLLRRSRLVVLSACSTVNGPSGEPAEKGSLAQSFLVLGVPQVVASRWVVDSLSTHEWMKAFYANMLTGQNSSRAAREASATVRDQPTWGHPYYWASFNVFSSIT